MGKYKVVKISGIKKTNSNKMILKKVEVYPYFLKNIGHAKACARMINSCINYSSKSNPILNVAVQDENGNIVFLARNNINGIHNLTIEGDDFSNGISGILP